MDAETEVQYRCPGESHPIDRAIHLGRLAVFYPGCRLCPHRDDRGTLPVPQVTRLAEMRPPADERELFGSEGILGVYHNQFTSGVARKFATAVAVALRREHAITDSPRVAVGGDGRSLTAELVAAASEGLRAAGCRVHDVGPVTAGCLVRAISHLPADGGMYVANAAGQSHTASLRAWGRLGCPWSTPGRLAAVRQTFETGVDRPVRSYGALQRSAVEDDYLSELQSHFHALRPLRVVLDTSCGPLVKVLERLLRRSACQIIRPREPDPHAWTDVASGKSKRPAPQSFLQDRLELVRRQVRAELAHVGIWIDGDGEVFHLVDERGFSVHPERCLVMLARHMIAQQPESTVVLERATSPQTVQAIAGVGGRVTLADATRQAIFEAMDLAGAVIAGGPSGRIFFAADAVDAGVATADALRMLSRLLPLLSQTDRPLSGVLDAA